MNPPPADDAARAMTEGARPVVSPRATDVEGIERVYVWDLIVRGTHWTVVITVVILSLTGIYIGRPFLISTTGDPLVVMGTVKTVHYYTAIAFAIAVVVRLYWLFAGPYYARWHQLIPLTRERRKNMVDMIKFYSFIGGEHPPLNVGHNGLAGIFYIGVFVSYIVMILTGLALYSVSAKGAWGQSFDWLLVLFGGAQSARLIHHLGMWFILGFFGHHIWSAILVTRMEGIGLMDSIFSGYKFLPKSWKNRDP